VAEEDAEMQEKEAKAVAKKRKEERKKRRLAAEQKRNAKLENLYRSKKSFELWRFKSIHGNGCAVWPLWSDQSKSILKDLFVLSRVNSTVDLVTAGETVTNPQPTAQSNAIADEQTLNDEALAQSLAAAENADDGEPSAKRRRTTRRAAGGDEPVFYGSHQSISRDQLLSTLVRILRQAKPGSSSIMKLKQMVFASDYDTSRGEVVEWRKLRSALGHLVFRMGRLGRLLVDVAGDSACRELLRENALVKFDQPPASKEATADEVAPPHQPDGDLVAKLSQLEQYVQSLHLTELSLRAALMKAIDKGGQSGESLLQISTVAIATAADEVEGDAGAEDWKFFTTDEVKGSISWSNSDHYLLGVSIFRPSTSPIISSGSTAKGQKCQWYRVISFTPSVQGGEASIEDARQTQDPNAFEPNPIVARRMRFRAIPIAASDVDSKMDIDNDDSNDIEFMVLTESQVRAVRVFNSTSFVSLLFLLLLICYTSLNNKGMEAAILHRKVCARSLAQGEPVKPPSVTHPFKNKTGSKVMLTPIVDGQTDESKIIYGLIAGHEYSIENQNISRVLILLEEEKENDNSHAFWSTVNTDGTLLTDIAQDPEYSLCESYKIEMHEYFQGSEAYSACEAVLSYMRSHQKSGPFALPVDPVALGLPGEFAPLVSIS
jgi:hypothetical protein